MATFGGGPTGTGATTPPSSVLAMARSLLLGVLRGWLTFWWTVVPRVTFRFYFPHHFFQLLLSRHACLLSPYFPIDFGLLVGFIYITDDDSREVILCYSQSLCRTKWIVKIVPGYGWIVLIYPIPTYSPVTILMFYSVYKKYCSGPPTSSLVML